MNCLFGIFKDTFLFRSIITQPIPITESTCLLDQILVDQTVERNMLHPEFNDRDLT